MVCRRARAVSGLLVLRSFTVRYATTLLFILVVGLVYYFVPNAKVRFRDVWIGALVTGLLWKGALEGFSCTSVTCRGSRGSTARLPSSSFSWCGSTCRR